MLRTLIVCALFAQTALGQEREEPILYGNMDHWVTRHIKESAIIGGNEKTLYEIGPDRVLEGNVPYRNLGRSPWATSNVMAKVMGIVKTNQSVYRDTHGGGHCAKLMTHIEHVKVFGMINISVLAAGSIFLGDVHEPIGGTKDGERALNWGIPYTQRPRALRFDYRVSLTGESNRIKQTGFSKVQTVPGKDCATAVLFLQKRTEDAQGNVTAKRVGTVVVEFAKSTAGWVANATYPVLYGDIRRQAHGATFHRLRAQQSRQERPAQRDGLGCGRRRAHTSHRSVLLEQWWSLHRLAGQHTVDRQCAVGFLILEEAFCCSSSACGQADCKHRNRYLRSTRLRPPRWYLSRRTLGRLTA